MIRYQEKYQEGLQQNSFIFYEVDEKNTEIKRLAYKFY